MRPKTDSVVYRPDLGQVVMAFVEGATMGFIGLELMPVFRAPEQSATYPVIPADVLLSIADGTRAPRGRYQRDDWTYERGMYATHEKGHEEPVDDVERKLFDQEAPGMADLVAVQRAFGKIMRGQEKRVADRLFNATNFTPSAVTNEWDKASDAEPITDVNDAVLTLRAQCGMLPDALVISFYTYRKLKECDQIVDRLKYTFPGIDINRMTSEQLAAVFDVPRVLVGGAVYNSAGKGLAVNVADLWNKEYAMLLKISSGPDITQPGVGRTFLWTEDSPQNPVVESYREEQTRSDIFRVRHHVDEALMRSVDDSGNVKSNIAAKCAVLLSNISQ